MRRRLGPGASRKTPEKGGVTLTVQPHPDKRPGHLRFMVSDTDIGIPPDKLTAILEDFTQAQSSTTRRFGGTGLGLGICRRLVKHMGGQLNVQSVLGHGSTFVFDVFLSVRMQAAPLIYKELADLAGLRVLVVDDNSTNRSVLCKNCTDWGLTAVEAATAAEAGEVLRNASDSANAFSLVLLHHPMPGTYQFGLLEQLLGIDPAVAVILTSAHGQPCDETAAKALGAAAYVPQPIGETELRSVVAAALRANKDSAARPPDGPVADQLEVMKILIADDSEDNRFLLAAYLNNLSYQLTFAEDGQKAFEAFSNHQFDLVLMDIQMPDGRSFSDFLHPRVRTRALHQSDSHCGSDRRCSRGRCRAKPSRRLQRSFVEANLESKPPRRH